jgi:uncharacterized repeat protein (TIGR01451 family)
MNVPPSQAQSCPLGQGFWKTHPDAWKVGGLYLGTQFYSKAQLLSLLHTPVRGDASLILAYQLIAALLNIANGSDPTPVSTTVADANDSLGAARIPEQIRPSSALGHRMASDAAILETYNENALPGSCGAQANRPPVADAGADFTVHVGDTALLDGRLSSDPDGDELSFSWSVLSQPSGANVQLSDVSAVQPTFVVPLPGEYIIELTVTDPGGLSSSATVTVSTVNSPPIAFAGADATYPAVGTTVALSGSGIDVDGDTFTAQWTFVSKPDTSAATLLNADTLTPTFAIDVPGDYTVRLTLTDVHGAMGSDEVVISTVDSPPIADAGPDQVDVPLGTSVTLDGSGSRDPDDVPPGTDPITFAWSFTKRPTGSIAQLVNPATSAPSFVPDRKGDYFIQLIVTDSHGLASAADVVRVSTLNQPPVANDDAYSTSEGAELSVTATDGVLANDSDPDGDTLTATLVASPANGTLTLVSNGGFTYTPKAGFSGQDTFTYQADDGIDKSAVATVRITVTAQADLAVTKTVNNASPAVGSNLTFTITVTNNGPSAATGVQVTDLLPSGYTFVSSNASQGAYASGTGMWTVGDLAKGASATLQITTTVLATGQYANTASGTATTADPTPGNNSATVAVTPAAQADLAVTKTVNNASPAVGSNVTFTVTVTNNGPSPATGVQVNDLLPSGYTFVSSNASQGAYASGTGMWTVGDLANGASTTLQITATVLATGQYANTASGTATTADPNPGNNSATVAVTPAAQADLAVTKTVNNASPAVGSNVTFTITITNSGPSVATGVQVTDLLPSGHAFVSSSTSQGAYASGTGIWIVGDLANGASATLQITTTVLVAGQYTNTATRTASSPADPNSANDSAWATAAPPAAGLVCGSLLSGSIDQAGEADRFAFAGVQGTTIDLTLVATGGNWNFPLTQIPRMTIFAPSGASLGAFNANSQNTLTLPETGTYLVRVNASNLVTTGTYSLGLECLQPPQPIDAALSCGDLQSGEIGAPGEVDLLTFTGTAGEVKDLTLVATGGNWNFPLTQIPRMTIFAPSGASLGAFNANSQNTLTLPETGTYLVRVNASNLVTTGSYDLGLVCVP